MVLLYIYKSINIKRVRFQAGFNESKFNEFLSSIEEENSARIDINTYLNSCKEIKSKKWKQCSLIKDPLSKHLLLPRKEVIQPQIPLRLPCYNFTLITDSTVGP